MSKTFLVTGGAGYIGSHTVEALLKANYKVVIIDDLSTGNARLIHPLAKFVKLSVLSTEEVFRILKDENIDGVIHFAAKIIVPESITSPLTYYRNNIYGVLSVLEACKKANVKNFVFSSTAAVYGNTGDELISESTKTDPLNPYGFSKLFSEQIIKDCEKEFGLNSVILRYFNVAGASQSLKFGQMSKVATHLIKIASEAACGKRDFVAITGSDYPTFDGTGIRDYIHVEDLAEIHVLALEYLFNGGKSDILNCGYAHGLSVRQVIQAIKKVSGVDFKVIESERRLGDAAQLIANNAKLRSVLRWSPKNDDIELICRSAYLFEKLICP